MAVFPCEDLQTGSHTGDSKKRIRSKERKGEGPRGVKEDLSECHIKTQILAEEFPNEPMASSFHMQER